MLTVSDIELRVVGAAVQVFRDEYELSPGETQLAAIARLSSVPPGHVRQVLRQFGCKFYDGDGVAMTRPVYEQLEAYVTMPLHEPGPGSPQYNVHVGDRSQVQVGHEVSGTQSMVTYADVFNSLEQRIAQSDAKPDEKKGAIQKLKELLALPVVSAAATEIVKAAGKHLLGGP